MSIRMSDLAPGGRGRVMGIDSAGSMRGRLLDLGLVPGAMVERVFSSPIGDPACYRVCGAMIALRSADAGSILVEI